MRPDFYTYKETYRDPAKLALNALTQPDILSGRERRNLRRKNERRGIQT